MKLNSIWIVTTGSRGDVQPYVAVATSLKQRGYSIRFFTNENHVSLPESFGVSTTAICPDIQDVLGTTIEENQFLRGMATANMNDLTEGVKLLNVKCAPYIRDKLQSLLEQEEKQQQQQQGLPQLPDLVVVNILSLGVAWYLALKHNIPYYELNCSENTFNPKYASGGLPTPPFQLHYYFTKYLIPIFKRDLNMPILEALDSTLASQFKNDAPMEDALNPALPRGCMISPEIANVLHPQASPKITFVGCTTVSVKPNEELVHMEDFGGSGGGTETYEKLERFLKQDSKKKPIYIGWGSMLCKSSEYMVELCVRTIYHCKQRAIVLGGMAKLSEDLLFQKKKNEGDDGGTTCMMDLDPEILEYAKSNMLFVTTAVSHEWLFPKCSVIVHHGGAGTTTAAIRSGVPTIITPLITDQFDYAYATNQLGVGVGMKQLHTITYQELGDTILRVLQDDTMARKAAELGTIVRRENGAEKAADAIEAYWNEYGGSEGKFRQVWPGTKPPSWWKKFLMSCGLITTTTTKAN